MEKDELFEYLKNHTKILSKPAIEKAFKNIDRADFLAEDYKSEAYEDYAVPIGKGENATKPSVAAFMIELLEVMPGNRVLEIGSGSGYTSALLADIVGSKGKIVGTERHPELIAESQKNLNKYPYKNIEIRQTGKSLGLPEEAPYDRILVTASAGDILPEIVSQLVLGGVMVMVVDDAIVQVRKKTKAETETKYFPGFMFDELGL